MRLDEPDPKAAWDERVAELSGRARRPQRASPRRARAPRARDRAHDRAAPVVGSGWPATSRRATGCATSPTCRPRRSSPRPTRARRRARHLDAPARPQGRNDRPRAPRPVRGRPRGRGRRRRERGGNARDGRDRPRARPPRRGRAGRRTGTDRPDSAPPSSTRCSTRTPRATSLSAPPTGSRPATRRTGPRLNTSAIHVDFMIGSEELEVTGVTADGDARTRTARRRLDICRFREPLMRVRWLPLPS